MSIFEFDEERYKKMMQKEYREEGRAEGHKAGIAEGRRRFTAVILDFLSELGEIPDSLREKILEEHDLETLGRWLKLAAKAESFADFEKKMD